MKMHEQLHLTERIWLPIIKVLCFTEYSPLCEAASLDELIPAIACSYENISKL